jgi:hypothetical protein
MGHSLFAAGLSGSVSQHGMPPVPGFVFASSAHILTDMHFGHGMLETFTP